MAQEAATTAEGAGNGAYLSDGFKTWGNHKLVRFHMADGAPLANGRRTRHVEEEDGEDEDGGLEGVRVRLLDRVRAAAERVQLKIDFAGEKPLAAGDPSSSVAAASVVVERPWNLRSSKVARGGGGDDEERSSEKPPERRKFAVELTSGEIEEDIYSVTGSLPRRRPKKRARAVQRRLNALFPGSWLKEVSPDLYK